MAKILIVEDEAAIRENYADVLRHQGYQVQTYAVDASANLIYSIGLWGDTQTPALAAHHFYSGAASYIPLVSTH